MAKQTAIDYDSLEWKDDAAGGTPIEAAALNRMEQGIADACAGVDQLRTKRLPTYLVAQDGDTATQDLYLETILGPCLILDLAERATYYDNGEDGEGHERSLITSGADIDALRDSLSHIIFGSRATHITAYYSDDLKAMVLTVRRDDERRYNVLLHDDGTVKGLVQDKGPVQDL